MRLLRPRCKRMPARAKGMCAPSSSQGNRSSSHGNRALVMPFYPAFSALHSNLSLVLVRSLSLVLSRSLPFILVCSLSSFEPSFLPANSPRAPPRYIGAQIRFVAACFTGPVRREKVYRCLHRPVCSRWMRAHWMHRGSISRQRSPPLSF